MDMFAGLIRLAAVIALAFLTGRLVARFRLPAILGWLIAGMVLGPHAVGLLSERMMDARWYSAVEGLMECTAGMMIGTELILGNMKRTGGQLLVMTVAESLGTFFVVSLAFGMIFWATGIPVYLAFLFGGIALATAPAPSLSIVNEFKTSGPVTRTLIPMAVLDDMVGAVVFFLVMAFVTLSSSAQEIPVAAVIVVVLLPLFIGAAGGLAGGLLLRLIHSRQGEILVTFLMLLAVTGAGFLVDSLLPVQVMNFMLLGMAFSTVYSNLINGEQRREIMEVMNPIIGGALIVVILNLGAPLDYHLVFGAGLYTAVYILSRAIGKYGGAWLGAVITHAPDTVRRYLGFTLLPHSGISLIFTGIAVSVLEGTAPEYAVLIQGTIAAAAVINEIIAVYMAKKGFEWAGELQKAEKGRSRKRTGGAA